MCRNGIRALHRPLLAALRAQRSHRQRAPRLLHRISILERNLHALCAGFRNAVSIKPPLHHAFRTTALNCARDFARILCAHLHFGVVLFCGPLESYNLPTPMGVITQGTCQTMTQPHDSFSLRWHIHQTHKNVVATRRHQGRLRKRRSACPRSSFCHALGAVSTMSRVSVGHSVVSSYPAALVA